MPLKGMEVTPNSPVSRNVKVRTTVRSLSSVLRTATLDDSPAPVRLLFRTTGAISVWTHDIARTMQVYVVNWRFDDLKVKEDCILLVDPKEAYSCITSKFGPDEVVKITTEAAQPIVFKNRSGASLTIMPADEDECNMCPDRWVLPYHPDGTRTFPMFDEQNGAYCDIALSELRKGLSDMATAKAPYVEFSFSPAGSVCQAGHWSAKTVKARTPVDTHTLTEPFTVRFTENLSTILGRFSSDTITLRLTKHPQAPFVVIDTLAGSKWCSVVATEAIKER